MPIKTTRPVRIPVPARKQIEEYVRSESTQTSSLSVAHMNAPPGWSEPFHPPPFAVATYFIRWSMRVEHDDGFMDVATGEVILVESEERVRYSNPFEEECEYYAVCTPAFSAPMANREDEAQ